MLSGERDREANSFEVEASLLKRRRFRRDSPWAPLRIGMVMAGKTGFRSTPALLGLVPALREFLAVHDKFRIRPGPKFVKIHSLPLAFCIHPLRVEPI
jgi:hypothetical protein